MQRTTSHPKLWFAYALALITGQSGLYNLYLGRSGSAVVMSGASFLIPVIWLAAPSRIALYVILTVCLMLTAVWVVDLIRMKALVALAHEKTDSGREHAA